MIKNRFFALFTLATLTTSTLAAKDAKETEMPDQWTKDINTTNPADHPDLKWFTDAKFGIFMHWGLYSQAGNVWKGKNFYGSGEWLMHQAKIPVAEYEKLAQQFNPTNFNADDWASFIHDSGAKYLVITAKHHEGFAMYGSKVSPYNIVDATPYKKDPMTELSAACRKHDVHFGFYYSQFLDWHEANGGGNTWDFDKASKDVKKYYAEKSMPQIKELCSNYGPLGIMWFDMPGGLTKDETASFITDVRKIQPACLISSRVGQGLGDFKDLGDSELPPTPVTGAWEALFTHTDSWGFQKYDQNFKSPTEVIHLLASTAARGGNFILNVGPDGQGNIPEKSRQYLLEVGQWLRANGAAIYATTASTIPDQPWGVCTNKPGTLYLHILQPPHNNIVYVPNFTAEAKSAFMLGEQSHLQCQKIGDALLVTLPENLPPSPDHIIQVDYTGKLKDAWKSTPTVISKQFDSLAIDSSNASLAGVSKLESKTYSRYFGNWKHDSVITSQQAPTDTATFNLNVIEPGDYRLILEYACVDPTSKSREGAVTINENSYTFETLATAPFDSHEPLLFVRHTIGIIPLKNSGRTNFTIAPTKPGTPIFWLRRLILEPIK